VASSVLEGKVVNDQIHEDSFLGAQTLLPTRVMLHIGEREFGAARGAPRSPYTPADRDLHSIACIPSPSMRMTVDRPRALWARWSSTSMIRSFGGCRRKIDRPGHPHRVYDITEGGYNLGDLTEQFRLNDPAAADLTCDHPETAYGC
jgi:hypothetical protein